MKSAGENDVIRQAVAKIFPYDIYFAVGAEQQRLSAAVLQVLGRPVGLVEAESPPLKAATVVEQGPSCWQKWLSFQKFHRSKPN